MYMYFKFSIQGNNKYWEIYLTVLDFWTGQIFPKILYTFYEEAQNFIKKKKECPRLIQEQSKNEILSNFIVQSQVEIYYWHGTMSVMTSDFWYWCSTSQTPDNNSTGSWKSVLGWYLKAVLVQYYQPVLITVISTALVVNQQSANCQ